MSKGTKRGTKKGPEARRSGARPARKAGAPATRSVVTRVLLGTLLVLLALGVLLGVLVLRVGPERVKERARALVPGLTETLVIPEGFTLFQVAERLEMLGVCEKRGFLAAAFDPVRLGELGIQAPSAEGYLYPATYQLGREQEPARVLARLVRERRKHLSQLGTELGAAHLSEHALLTLASIVERETRVPAERPRVAQVFFNRLADVEGPTRGRLQSDPTAAYYCQLPAAAAPSCQGFNGRVSPEMLKDAANPYNTYRITGLPPGPIASPGESAIEAVLRPSGGDELYFVADGSGGHRFSSNFEDHRRAVEALKAGEN